MRVAQNFWGGCSPLRPPGPYAYANGKSSCEIFLGQSGLTVKENVREKRLMKLKTISRAQKIQILRLPPHATIYVDQYSILSRRVNVLNTKTLKRDISSSSQSWWNKGRIFDMLRIVDLVVFFSWIWPISGKILYEEIFGVWIFLLQGALLNGYHTALNLCYLRKLYAKF